MNQRNKKKERQDPKKVSGQDNCKEMNSGENVEGEKGTMLSYGKTSRTGKEEWQPIVH